ncbi:phosphate acyltransferase PlsX [Candidatus Foliamicus sp.]
MSKFVTIAVDAMSGDLGPDVAVPASLEMLRSRDELRLILVGDADTVRRHCGRLGKESNRVEIHHADQVVSMEDTPSEALRRKKRSSMRVAVELVRSGEAQACVSAGNTGALMATGRLLLRMLPGIDRPAILVALPTMQGVCYMLDLGANPVCTPTHLLQFAVMGSVIASINGVENPAIRLLNNGEEEIKGIETVQAANALLSESHLNYQGFVEPNDVFKHRADVVVCDGFTGNIALKTMEGSAQFAYRQMVSYLRSSWLTRAYGLACWPFLYAIKKRLDPNRHNGATLVGLNGIVVKSHGSSNEIGWQQAIHLAMREAEKGMNERIQGLWSNMAA